MSDETPAGLDRDFPFYKDVPVVIGGLQWCFVMAMNAAGFAMLVAPLPFFQNVWMAFVPAILFPALPLIGLAIVAREHWIAIFRKVTMRSILLMFGFALLNMAITIPIGLLVSSLKGVASNPALVNLGELAPWDLMLFFLRSAFSLFGEEVMSILPFLALLWWFTSKLKFSRTTALAGAWAISAALFGLAHLSTYNWDFVQCLVIIGSARIALTLAYIYTKNLWVSTGAHIINDWVFFGMAILGASLQNS